MIKSFIVFSLLDDSDTYPIDQMSASGFTLVGIVKPHAAENEKAYEECFTKVDFHD
jgi:hypothetical protein